MIAPDEYLNENSRNSVSTIGTTAVKICEKMPIGIRRIISFSNRSTTGQVVTIAIGGAAAVNQGIPLLVGSTWTESVSENFYPTNDEVWAISSGANATLSIYERIKSV